MESEDRTSRIDLADAAAPAGTDYRSQASNFFGDDAGMLGRVIAGKYRLTACIGEGGMGTIFQGLDLSLNRAVAVKLLRPSMLQNEKSVQRFQQEGKAASRLKHPNIVTVYEFGMHNEVQPYLVMEYVEGETLADILARQRTLAIERVLELAHQACQGLNHAHQNKVIHRDLKPSNILLTRNGKQELLKIVDFGIAKIAVDDGADLTSTGEIFGSPFYMSPEQCYGFSLDGRADIYSLGCVLYECLTGGPPHVGDSPLITIAKHEHDEPLSLKEASLGADYSDDLERIIAKTLAKQPIDRYASAAALDFEITNLLQGKAYQAAPVEKEMSQAEQFQRDAAATSFRHFQNIRMPSVEAKQAGGGIKLRKLTVVSLSMFALAGMLILGMWISNQLSDSKSASTVKPYQPPPMTGSEKHAIMDDPKIEWEQYKHYPKLAVMQEFKGGLFEPPPGEWVLLKRMTSLRSLDLATANFQDRDMQYVADLPLVMLNLRNTRVTAAGLQQLTAMTKLRILNLSGNRVSNQGLTHLPSGLTELIVSHNTMITGSGLRPLVKLKHLCSLNLHDAHSVRDDAVPILAEMKGLEYLDISKSGITDAACQKLKALLPNCLIISSVDSNDFSNWEHDSHQPMVHEEL